MGTVCDTNDMERTDYFELFFTIIQFVESGINHFFIDISYLKRKDSIEIFRTLKNQGISFTIIVASLEDISSDIIEILYNRHTDLLLILNIEDSYENVINKINSIIPKWIIMKSEIILSQKEKTEKKIKCVDLKHFNFKRVYMYYLNQTSHINSLNAFFSYNHISELTECMLQYAIFNESCNFIFLSEYGNIYSINRVNREIEKNGNIKEKSIRKLLKK